MCRKVKCTGCGLATWQGCGLHIDSALNGVAECDRCSGWQTGVCQPATADDTTGDTTGEIKKEEEEMNTSNKDDTRIPRSKKSSI